MTTVIIAQFTVVGTFDDIEEFRNGFLTYDPITQNWNVNLGAVCPLDGDDPSEAWGAFSYIEVVDQDSDIGFYVIHFKTDSTIQPFVRRLATVYFPHLAFLLREINYTEGLMSRLYCIRGDEDPDNQQLTIPVRFMAFTNQFIQMYRRVRWSVRLNAWVYYQPVDHEDNLLDNQSDQSPIQEQADGDDIYDIIPLNPGDAQEQNDLADNGEEEEDVIADLDTPAAVTTFLRGLEVVCINAGDEDFILDGVSDIYIEREIPDNEYDDYADEDAYDDDEDAEHVTIALLTGPINEDMLCSICIATPTDPKITSCSHVYCSDCIDEWLKTPASGHRCPNCKRIID